MIDISPRIQEARRSLPRFDNAARDWRIQLDGDRDQIISPGQAGISAE
jgi:hypothetical protein